MVFLFNVTVVELIPGNGMLSTLDLRFQLLHQNFHGHSVVCVPHTHIVHTSVFIDDLYKLF